MTTEFTPGPWRVYSEYGSIGTITNADGSVVVAQAQQVEPRSQKTRLANTHLIAAAPSLLAALEALLDMDISYQRGPKVQGAESAARLAVAKARGET